ncbi:hypothetical protein ABIB26_004679 [Arthrobacter sp. UYEF20]
MKKRSPHRSAHGRKDAGASGPKTGEHCPATGWWAPAGNDAGAQFLSEGSLMPPDNGEIAFWALVSARHESPKPKYDYPASGISVDSL